MLIRSQYRWYLKNAVNTRQNSKNINGKRAGKNSRPMSIKARCSQFRNDPIFREEKTWPRDYSVFLRFIQEPKSPAGLIASLFPGYLVIDREETQRALCFQCRLKVEFKTLRASGIPETYRVKPFVYTCADYAAAPFSPLSRFIRFHTESTH